MIFLKKRFNQRFPKHMVLIYYNTTANASAIQKKIPVTVLFMSNFSNEKAMVDYTA